MRLCRICVGLLRSLHVPSPTAPTETAAPISPSNKVYEPAISLLDKTCLARVAASSCYHRTARRLTGEAIMSQNAGAYIYQGPWINWNHGLIRGSTITLSIRNGAILIAFLALLVKFAGGQLWGIAKYVIHQRRASQSPRSGLYHQIQAILRNADSASQAAKELLQASFYWRKHAKNPFLRSVALAMFPLINLVAFGIAGKLVIALTYLIMAHSAPSRNVGCHHQHRLTHYRGSCAFTLIATRHLQLGSFQSRGR